MLLRADKHPVAALGAVGDAKTTGAKDHPPRRAARWLITPLIFCPATLPISCGMVFSSQSEFLSISIDRRDSR